jgi:F420-dependent oxidoreductase-like protein
MRLGLNLGYWGAGNDAENLALAVEADRLGFSVAWVAEAYGSDAPTVLAWVAAQTSHIDVGSAVMQIPARTPAMTAMTAATLDTLSGGRFRLGLGVSGPQVSEGWHGVRFDAPLSRTREYVEIVRMALRRERVEFSGRHWTLPLPDGPGKALRLTVHPVRKDISVYLAAVGPKNLELAGEIADGWLGIFFSPEHAEISLEPIRAGRARRSGTAGDDGLAGFDVVPSVPVVIHDDPAVAANAIRPYTALYVGGMGSREKNFYNALMRRMGYEAEAARVQDLFLGQEPREAAAALPQAFLESTAVLGPPAALPDRLQAFAAAGVTTLSVIPFAPTLEARIATLRALVEAADAAGVAS